MRCYRTKQNSYLNREALELGGLGLQVWVYLTRYYKEKRTYWR